MSNIEEKARDQGWRPKEEWEGDPDQWVDAKEFVYRGELMNRISEQNRQIKNLQKRHTTEVQDLKKKLLKLGEQWTKDTMSNLEADIEAAEQMYEEAVRNEDSARATKIREYMKDLQNKKGDLKTASDEIEQDKQSSELPQFTPLQEDVIEHVRNKYMPENPWYGKDPVLTNVFNTIGDQFIEQGDYMSGEELVNDIHEELKRRFPDRLGLDEEDVQPRRKASTPPSRQEPTHAAPSRKRSSKFRSLTAEEEAVMKNFTRAGIMTEEEYIKSLREMEE